MGVGARGTALIRTILDTDTAEVVAVSDPHPESMSRAKEIVPAAACHDDVASMLKTEQLDVLVVSSPQYLHRPACEAGLKAGIDVFCEKPLAHTLIECDRIVRAVERSASLFYVGMQLRTMEIFRYVHEITRSGRIGRPCLLSYTENRVPFFPKVNGWLGDAAKSGGTLVEKCCHHFDLFSLLADSPADRVYATGGKAIPSEDGGNPGDLIDHALAVVEYANRVRACLSLCMFSAWSLHELDVTGTAGRLRANPKHSTCLCHMTSSAEPERRTFDKNDLHGNAQVWRDFLQHRTDEGRRTSVQRAVAGREAVRVALAATESMRTGAVVRL